MPILIELLKIAAVVQIVILAANFVLPRKLSCREHVACTGHYGLMSISRTTITRIGRLAVVLSLATLY